MIIGNLIVVILLSLFALGLFVATYVCFKDREPTGILSLAFGLGLFFVISIIPITESTKQINQKALKVDNGVLFENIDNNTFYYDTTSIVFANHNNYKLVKGCGYNVFGFEIDSYEYITKRDN